MTQASTGALLVLEAPTLQLCPCAAFSPRTGDQRAASPPAGSLHPGRREAKRATSDKDTTGTQGHWEVQTVTRELLFS